MIYFDLDNTLIDYNSSERKAIEFIFKEKYGLVLNNKAQSQNLWDLGFLT